MDKMPVMYHCNVQTRFSFNLHVCFVGNTSKYMVQSEMHPYEEAHNLNVYAQLLRAVAKMQSLGVCRLDIAIIDRSNYRFGVFGIYHKLILRLIVALWRECGPQ